MSADRPGSNPTRTTFFSYKQCQPSPCAPLSPQTQGASTSRQCPLLRELTHWIRFAVIKMPFSLPQEKFSPLEVHAVVDPGSLCTLSLFKLIISDSWLLMIQLPLPISACAQTEFSIPHQGQLPSSGISHPSSIPHSVCMLHLTTSSVFSFPLCFKLPDPQQGFAFSSSF